MKSIEFSEEQLGNLDEIAKELFGDENDPTSSSYKRQLVRPKIPWLKILLWCFAAIIISGMLFFAVYFFSKSVLWSSVTAGLSLLVFFLVRLKAIAIGMVRIYQRFAPDSVRKKCRFEPSCSEYMILSIEKYGLIKGVNNGIKRLKRCNINHGGYDYP